MAVKMRSTVVVFIISFLSWAALSIDITTTTNCYTNGTVTLNETCRPTQYILIHSVESQEVSNCSDQNPGGLWSRSGAEVHGVWLWCNMQKKRCTTGFLDKTTFLRMNYTCVDELSLIRRYDMCSYVSEVKSTPMYLQSPGYPGFHNYTNGSNCTCSLSAFRTQGSEAIRLTVFDMFTQLPENVTLKWSDGTSKELTTVNEPSSGNIINQETVGTSSAFYVSFVPRSTGKGYFWIGLESEVPVDISITCNGGLGTSPTKAPTTATTPPTPAAVMAEDDIKTIYIVVPTVVIAIIIIIVGVVIVKKKRKSNYTKSDDAVRFNVSELGVKAKENFAIDMVDNEIYQSEDSLGNSSLSGHLSSYGVGVAFGTFKGDKVCQRPNEDLLDIGEEKKGRQRGINALSKFETFGGEDLLLGDAAAGPSGGGDVIYAEVNKPKKNKNSEENRVQGQTSVLGQNPLNEQNGQTVTDLIPVEEETAYSLADDFDDPKEYFDYDVGEGSAQATNDAAAPDDDEDYAYAYTHRRGRGTSKRREPQQSLHIYDDVDSDDCEFAESDIDGAYGVAMDVQIEVNGQEDEGTDGETDYDELDHEQKHKQNIDKIEHVQRTEGPFPLEHSR